MNITETQYQLAYLRQMEQNNLELWRTEEAAAQPNDLGQLYFDAYQAYKGSADKLDLAIKYLGEAQEISAKIKEHNQTEDLKDSNIYLLDDMGPGSLQRIFNEHDHLIVMDWITSLACKGNVEADMIMDETIHGDKYSASLVVKYQGHRFSIYSSFGDFRFGSESGNTVPDQVIENFINEIKK
jgi:hypothetical protein